MSTVPISKARVTATGAAEPRPLAEHLATLPDGSLSASRITSGLLPEARGGTGAASVSSSTVTATGSTTARALKDHLATLPDAQITATGTSTTRSLAGWAKEIGDVAAAAGVYESTTAGLAAVAEGAYFNVPATAASEAVILYRKESGVAVEKKRYPSTAAVDAARLTTGEWLSSFSPDAAALNGASLITVGGKNVGFSIPAAASGASTYLVAFMQPAADDVARLVGATIRLRLVATVTVGFLAAKPLAGLVAQVNRGAGNISVGTLARREQIGTQLFLEVLYAVTAPDVKFGPAFQIGSGATASGVDHSFQITSLSYSVESLASTGVTTTNDLGLDVRIAAASAASKTDILGGAYGATRTVAADGTGDHTTLAAANTAVTDATIAKRQRVRVRRGTYVGDDLIPKAYLDYIGDRTEDVVVQMHYPDTQATVDINTDSAFKQVGTNRLRGMTITARNARYAVHSEGSGANVGAVHEIEDSYLRHYGNEGARAYWVSQGQPSTAVWVPAHGIGLGLASGQRYVVRRSTLISDFASAFGAHNNADYADPAHILLEHSRLVSHATGGYAVYLASIGSFKDDAVEIVGCELVGDIVSYPSSWVHTALAKQPANHQEFKITGRGNSPSVFWTIDYGRALKIESAATSGTSTVAVSGDAVETLFGREVYSRPGAGGIKGYVYGWGDVSGVVAGTSLGARLGDCSVTPKALAVTVDGGAPINVVFNANHTVQSNADVLAIINAALGASATASAYDVGGRYRPHFTDEERNLLNGTAEGFLMGAVLAYDATRTKVRKMTSADDPSLFAGVAWEDIYPGQTGRVKTRGWLKIVDLLRNVPGALTFGETFSIDATMPGRIVRGGTQGLLRAIRSDAVEVAP
jgi:hypothetical protein